MIERKSDKLAVGSWQLAIGSQRSCHPTVLPSYRLIVLLSFIITLLPFCTSAQRLDSLLRIHDTTTIVYFQHHTDSLALQNYHTIRSTRVTGFQRYNPVNSADRFYASFANVGHAHQNLVFGRDPENAFHTGMHAFDLYTFTNPNTRYYRHLIPVTYLAYTSGAKKEQWFRVVHSHAITRNFNLGVDFNLINSPGRYANSKSDDKSVVFTGQYFSRNLRYGAIANYRYNKFVVMENGGIASDSIFENSLESDPSFVDVNLTTARNMLKESGVYANGFFYLSGGQAESDSSAVQTPTFHAGRIAYDFSFQRQAQLYTDSDPLAPFYEPFGPVLDSSRTFDSLMIHSFENRFSWSNLRMGENPSDKHVYVLFGIKNQNTVYQDSVVKKSFSTWVPEAALVIRPYRTLAIDLGGTFSIGDFNNTGFLLRGTARQEFRLKNGRQGDASFTFMTTTHQAGFFYQFFRSNYFRWDTAFNLQKDMRAGLEVRFNELKFNVDYLLAGDLVYLDREARPAQQSSAVSVLKASLSNEFRWKKWGIDASLVYQAVSDKDIIRVPEFMARVSIFPTLPLFGNAAIFQPGIDLFYNTAYYAMAYMPALRMFYLQDEKKIGNYIYADVFVNLMVKRFRIFAKYEHINALWSQPVYYMVPHYPSQPATFKFGMSWSFYD